MRSATRLCLTAFLGAGAAASLGRAAASAATAGNRWVGDMPSAQAQQPPHEGGGGAPRDADGRFTNPWPTWKGDKTPLEVWAFGRQMWALGVPNWGHLTANPRPTLGDMRAAFPVHAPDYAALREAGPGAVAAVWGGHACVLARVEGLTLLTDPVFAERASPLSFVGPRRAVPPPISVEDPALSVDAVLISHNHYDHLCEATVKRLHRRFGAALAWYVPLGLAAWLRARGVANVTELDWFGQAQHPGSKVRFVMTPAQHWSARGLNRRRTLWGGWAAIGERRRFFFAGDTGYAPIFREIGERLGPFDLAAIPIGAYDPRDFMGPQHVDPREAVTIHREIRARRSIAIHCCTFHLTLEALDEPPALLAREAAAQGLAEDEFVCLQHGAALVVEDGRVLNGPLHTLPLALPPGCTSQRPPPSGDQGRGPSEEL